MKTFEETVMSSPKKKKELFKVRVEKFSFLKYKIMLRAQKVPFPG